MTAILPITADSSKPGYKLDKLILSHSTASLFDGTCKRKFEFRKMFGNTADKEEEDLPAGVGKAIHAGYQTFLITRDMDKAGFALALNYPYAVFEQAKLEKKSGVNERSIWACYSTLMAMMTSHQLGDYEVIYIRSRDGIEHPACEVPFAIRITGSSFPLPVWFVGFIDCVLFNKVTGEYIVVDIKSSRRYIKDYSARYEYDAQCLPYGIILEHLLGGMKIPQFKVAYFAVYIDLLEPKANLYEFTKTPDLISDWHRSTCDTIDQITQYYKAQWFPRANSGEACYSFGKECFYREFCHTRDPVLVQRLLNGTLQEKLFSNGEEPWVIADMPYTKPFNQ